MKITISRKFSLDQSNETLNIELNFKNKLEKEYNKEYIISNISPEGWKSDQPKLNFAKDKKIDKKNMKLMLKSPIIEWRLSAGNFE